MRPKHVKRTNLILLQGVRRGGGGSSVLTSSQASPLCLLMHLNVKRTVNLKHASRGDNLQMLPGVRHPSCLEDAAVDLSYISVPAAKLCCGPSAPPGVITVSGSLCLIRTPGCRSSPPTITTDRTSPLRMTPGPPRWEPSTPSSTSSYVSPSVTEGRRFYT